MNRWKPGDLIMFKDDEDFDKFSCFIGLVLPQRDYHKPIRILWNDGQLEEYEEKFCEYFETINETQN